MIVNIVLDKPHGVFTNLDEVNGKVFLRLNSSIAVTSIVVKLEGESKTRLAEGTEKKKAFFELHKLLYKREIVFPPAALQDDTLDKKGYTLTPGVHEYPFKFKIPFNNSCYNVSNPSKSLFNELASPMLLHNAHMKGTLPPSMSGFPGEADISYFVKVTVARPQFYLENVRTTSYLTFLPIEPPTDKTEGEAYARRQHRFLKRPGTPKAVRSNSGFGRKKTSWSTDSKSPSPSSTEIAAGAPARFSAEVRLPNPATITCNQDVPLKVLIKRLSSPTEALYLQSLQVELIGYTNVRAQLLDRKESSSWVIFSKSNMATSIGSPSDPEGTETPIPSSLWAGRPLPNTVAPSFKTCNISRSYELQVLVGLGYATAQHGKDQFVVLPLRLPITVLSGIRPPKALLTAMAQSPTTVDDPIINNNNNNTTLQPPRPTAVLRRPTAAAATTVTEGPAPAYSPMQQEGQGLGQGAVPSSAAAPMYDDAPPSYEDAVGSTMPPVTGPRGDYAPPPSTSEDERFRNAKR